MEKLCFVKKSEHQVFSKKSCIEEKFQKIQKFKNRKNNNSSFYICFLEFLYR